ncbi:MAG: ABC transporter permease [Lachnospiraceae bacterium]|nr:ABC transporter permease [Lachnospiraceae bacterium]
MEEKKKGGFNVKKLLENTRILVLLVLVIFFTIMKPGTFFTYRNFVSIMYSVSLIAIMICGAMFPVLLGGIDRTVSGNAAIAGAVMCSLISKQFNYSNGGAVIAILCALCAGLLSGLFHGTVMSRFAIPAFLLTLATNEVLYGIVQTITGNQLINNLNCGLTNYIGMQRWLGIPIPVYVLALCFVIMYFVLNHTVYGRQLYSTGGNRVAAELSGVPTKKIILIAYMMSGMMGALSGIMLSCMNQQASALQAQNYENNVLAAVVVGGVSMRGGSGTLQGAMLGAIIIGVMENGLRLMGIPSIYHDLAKGIIIMTAIAVDMVTAAKRSGMRLNSIRELFTRTKKVKA